ncbi:cyclic lactone autoinducer peptide (plasmid) [Lachnospira eligens]|uniref:Uncharacterized protein n=1 Tax=Lachnospira eligens (strain ATCC 27750 / DSM 3376 / VPI C15-48 / C15-B4) TaxID=515620 RepID=C4Z7G5_LACE2|nr:cyclic lactone autoinducer peptide [Lachnospira eligens]ACR73243.1 Hypothetical protein EUBELI_20096 [[Eubacterium] eligens ATCC 27750]UEA96724.1 cyclic lactone autoinducer peptide [Lachnospira eligens]
MTKDVKQVMAGKLQKLSVKVAVHYANVACPIITYQPKMSAEVKIHIIQQHLKITMVGQKIIRMGDIRLIILPDM